MDTKNFIKIYDNVLPWELLSSFLQVINKKEFIKAELLDKDNGTRVDTKIRKTAWLNLNQPNDSLTNIHWGNLLRTAFKPHINEYQEEFRFGLSQEKFLRHIIDVQCL